MKHLLLAIFAALCLFALPCKATITIDGTACAGGVVSACPTGQTLNTAGGAVTTTTSSFSTSKAGQILVMVGTTGGGFSGTVSVSGGSFTLPLTQITSVQHGGQTYGAMFTGVTSAALSSVTVSAANGNSNVNHTAVSVIPFASPVVLGQEVNNSGAGTTATLTSTNLLNDSLVFATFSDKASSTARTPAAGTTTVFDSMDATSNTDVYFAVTSTPITGGSATLSYSAPAVTFNGWSSFNLEAIDASLNAAQDPNACPLNGGQSATNLLINCPVGQGSFATTVTSSSFSTVTPNELICVEVQEVGVGVSTIAISDSGITKSTAWTKVGQSTSTTIQRSEVWCAVTSAAVSSNTITATFTATSLTFTNIGVIPYAYSQHTIPTNYVAANGTSGNASVTITPALTGSQIMGSFTYNTSTGPTVTSTPQAYAWNLNSDFTTYYLFAEYAWATGLSAETIGVTAPTSTVWSGQMAEVGPLVAAPSGPANSGMEGFWGSLDFFHTSGKGIR